MLSENLLKYRNESGFSKSQLAAISGVSRYTILRIENGETFSPGIYTLYKLAKALNVTVIDLLK